MDQNKPKRNLGFAGCSPILLMLIFAFGFFTLSASFPPLNNLIARHALCPTASTAYFREESGRVVHKIGVQQDVSGKVVTLYCVFEDDSVKEIQNDRVVVTGFGISASFGILIGLLVYFYMNFKSKTQTG